MRTNWGDTQTWKCNGSARVNAGCLDLWHGLQLIGDPLKPVVSGLETELEESARVL